MEICIQWFPCLFFLFIFYFLAAIGPSSEIICQITIYLVMILNNNYAFRKMEFMNYLIFLSYNPLYFLRKADFLRV